MGGRGFLKILSNLNGKQIHSCQKCIPGITNVRAEQEINAKAKAVWNKNSIRQKPKQKFIHWLVNLASTYPYKQPKQQFHLTLSWGEEDRRGSEVQGKERRHHSQWEHIQLKTITAITSENEWHFTKQKQKGNEKITDICHWPLSCFYYSEIVQDVSSEKKNRKMEH